MKIKKQTRTHLIILNMIKKLINYLLKIKLKDKKNFATGGCAATPMAFGWR
jgi:hypothetical protein